jgi:hypothetical protein
MLELLVPRRETKCDMYVDQLAWPVTGERARGVSDNAMAASFARVHVAARSAGRTESIARTTILSIPAKITRPFSGTPKRDISSLRGMNVD